MRIMPRPGTQQEMGIDPLILEFLKKQGAILPRSRNEQVSADNRTKELKKAQEADARIKQLGNTIKDIALNTAEGVTSMAYPYAGMVLSAKNAITNPNDAYIDAAATLLGSGYKPISRLLRKNKAITPKQFGKANRVAENKIWPKTYNELKTPDIRTPEEYEAVEKYKESSKYFKNDFSSQDNFYKSYLDNTGIPTEDLFNPKSPQAKIDADKIYKTYKPHSEALEKVITRTKGDRLKLIRHTDDNIPIGEYEPKRPLSFSFPEGSREFGQNRLIVEIPEEQSYLAIEKKIGNALKENEVILPRKLKFQVTKKHNQSGGDDYIGKILNPYLITSLMLNSLNMNKNEKK